MQGRRSAIWSSAYWYRYWFARQKKIYVEKQQQNTNSLLQTTLGSLPYAQRHGDIRFQITVFPARGVAALCTVQTNLLRKN